MSRLLTQSGDAWITHRLNGQGPGESGPLAVKGELRQVANLLASLATMALASGSPIICMC